MSKMFSVEFAELQAEVMLALRAAKCGKEICGVLINENGHLDLLPVKNAAGKCGAFEVTPSWCRIALRRNAADARKIIGTYHSHPVSSPEPGPGDIAGTWDSAFMLIIACHDARTRLWQINNGKASRVGLAMRRM